MPRSLAYECRRQTSSLSRLGLKVQLCLSVSSRTYNVLISTVTTLNASSFSATSTWRRWNANCGSLGSFADPYSRLKLEWMQDLAYNSLMAKSSALLLTSALLASSMALSPSLIWPKTVNLWERSTSSHSKLVTWDLNWVIQPLWLKGPDPSARAMLKVWQAQPRMSSQSH